MPTKTIGVTYASLMTLGPEMAFATAEQARDLGYSSFWTAETTGPEAFSTLAAISGRTPGLDLGTGVLALQLRTPLLATMGAATLQSLAPERTIHLGVGISSPVVVSRWHGASYGTRPLAQVRDYLNLAAACLSGDPVDHDGEFYVCKGFRLGVRLGERRPKLVLGALNEKMLRLAGELADGVLLNYLPASVVQWCVEQVRAGEATAGRPIGSCEVHAYVHVGVADRDAAADNARRISSPTPWSRRMRKRSPVPAFPTRWQPSPTLTAVATVREHWPRCRIAWSTPSTSSGTRPP